MDTHKRLKQLLDARGGSVRELAERLGIPNSTLANYFSGKTMVPLDVASLLADHFGVSLDDLAGRPGAPRLTDQEHHLLRQMRLIGLDEAEQRLLLAGRSSAGPTGALSPVREFTTPDAPEGKRRFSPEVMEASKPILRSGR